VKIKLHPLVKILVKLAITVAALWFVIARLDLQEILGTIAQSNLLLLAGALFLFVLSKLISSLRLNSYLGATGIHISLRANLKLYLLGMYYNLFLPGGIGGDGYKIFLLNLKFEVATRKIFWAVMMDRIIGVIALFCMAVVLFCFVPGMGKHAWYIWILIPFSVFVTYLIYKRFFPYLHGVFLSSNLLSLVVQLLQLLSALLILFSLKATDSLVGYLFVFLISSMVAVLPLTIGGIGSREFTFMLGAQWLGLDLNLSIALSILFFLITFFTSLWGIIYSFGPGVKLDE
jgi:uncharacterized membrane protein YbhN (UPF0104 family)